MFPEHILVETRSEWTIQLTERKKDDIAKRLKTLLEELLSRRVSCHTRDMVCLSHP